MEERKLKQLLSEMSLREKIGQMIQLTGIYFDGDAVLTGAVEEDMPPQWVIRYAGSVLGMIGAEKLRAIQKKYPELVIEGGADSQGPMFSNLASVEAGAAEARRCIDDYAGGRRYIAHVSRSGAPNAGHEGFYEEAWRYGHECYDTSADQSGKAVERR